MTGEVAGMLGWALEDQGRFAEAEALYQELLRLCRALGDKQWAPYGLNLLGVAAYHQGEIAHAAARWEEALSEFRALGSTYGAGIVLTNLAKVARERGDYDRATALFVESLSARSQFGDKIGIGACLRGLASVAALTHHFERSARLFGAAEALREAIGASVPRQHARHERTLAGVRAAMGEAAFAAAWAEGRDMPLPDVVAEALTELPVATGGGTAAARGQPVVSQFGLTSRERDVLRCLPRGLTNKEIGAELFITERTVTTHVQNILAKLGVNSRTQAAAIAVEHGLA
jgi:non-specific serine/threonine protein kinase